MKCAGCGGTEFWDNRSTKKGNQPDYRCKECKKGKWLESKEKAESRADTSAAGPAIGIFSGAEYVKLMQVVGDALVKMSTAWPASMKPTAADLQAACATIAIARQKMGLPLLNPKKSTKKKVIEEIEEEVEAEEYADDDALPF